MESHLTQRHLPVLLLLLLCLTLLPTTVAIECYSRNGVAASSSEFYNATRDGNLIGCGNNPTTCCLESQYCDVDLLCHDRKTGGLSRQYCSDPHWPEGSCSDVCPQYPAAGIALTSCDNTGTKFCCGPSNECCHTGHYTQINKKTGKVVAIGTSKVPTTTTATQTGSSSSTAAATTTGGTTSGAAATNTSSGDSGGMSEQTKLGIGLGVGLGVPFLGAIAAALFFWRRSSLSKAKGGNDASPPDEMAKVASSPGPGSPPAPGYGQDAAGVGAGAAAGPEGGVAELGDNTPNKPVYQLEAETNTRAELGDDRRVYELQ